MKCYLTLLIALILIACKTSKEDPANVKGSSEYTQGKWTDVVDPNASDYSCKVKDAFHTYRDSIKVANVLKSAINPMTRDDGFSRRIKLDNVENRYDSKLFIKIFAELAKSGDREVEKWLLGFFNKYIGEALKWNNTKSDGIGGRAELFLKPINASIFKWMNNLPPSLGKAHLFMRLYNVEPELYQHTSDVGSINADVAIYNVLRLMIVGENEKELPSWYYRTHISKTYKDKLNEEVKSLYERIKLGTLELVDRDKWETLEFIIVP